MIKYMAVKIMFNKKEVNMKKITIFIFKVRININYKIFIYIDKDSLKDDFKMN